MTSCSPKRGPPSKQLSQVAAHREVHSFLKPQLTVIKNPLRASCITLRFFLLLRHFFIHSQSLRSLGTTTPATTSRFHHTRMDFFAFPLEIRCLIYYHYGIRRCIRPFREADKQANHPAADEIAKCLDIVEPALLLSCHQIYDEAFQILRKRYTGLLPSGPFAARFLSKAEEKGFCGFQSLHLLVTAPELEAANLAITDAVCIPLNPDPGSPI